MKQIIKSDVTLLLLETCLVSPEIGPLCFSGDLDPSEFRAPSLFCEQKSFLISYLKREAIFRMHHCSLCEGAFSVYVSLCLSEQRSYERTTAGASHDTHFFLLSVKILNHQYTWLYDTGSKLGSYSYEVNSVKSFSTLIAKSPSGKREKRGSFKFHIYNTFSLYIIATDEREDHICYLPYKTSIAGILQRDLSPFSVLWLLNRVRR